LREAASEHHQILHYIEQKDYGGASAVMERHILNTGEAIRRFRERTAKGQ
jgi:DNA-binding GntR family transcriptional regulator